MTNKEESFLEKFPFGKVPAFEGADGLLLYESNAISYYGQFLFFSFLSLSFLLLWLEVGFLADEEFIPMLSLSDNILCCKLLA